MALKIFYYPVILVVVAIAACSCSNTKYNDVLPKDNDSTSTLDVINAVTDVTAINFYLNGTRQNNNSTIYLFNASGYVSVPKGEQQYQFKSDTFNVDNNMQRALLAEFKLNTPNTKGSYTMILAGQKSNNNLTSIFITDVFPTDTAAANILKSKVRFVQASPGTASYDVFVGDTLAFKNNAFKAYSTFQGVGGGKKVVKVMLSGTTTPILTDTVILQPSNYYTLYTRGIPAGVGNNKLGVSVNLSR